MATLLIATSSDWSKSDRIALLGLLVLAAVAAFIGLGILAWQLPRIFTAMPVPLYSGARTALLLMGGTFALGLPFSVIHAVFIGLQTNEISTAIVIGNRFVMAAMVAAVANRCSGLQNPILTATRKAV